MRGTALASLRIAAGGGDAGELQRLATLHLQVDESGVGHKLYAQIRGAAEDEHVIVVSCGGWTDGQTRGCRSSARSCRGWRAIEYVGAGDPGEFGAFDI